MQLTEVLNQEDSRAQCTAMRNDRRAEIESLLSQGTFKVIRKDEIPPDANVLPGRFVLSLKTTDDERVKHKQWYVIRSHRDILKSMMVNSSQTLQIFSIRLLLAIASIFEFKVWTADVIQAYLQSDEPRSREVYIQDFVPKFGLRKNQCVQLLKSLYGLCESGDFWHETLD